MHHQRRYQGLLFSSLAGSNIWGNILRRLMLGKHCWAGQMSVGAAVANAKVITVAADWNTRNNIHSVREEKYVQCWT